jgi:hypothetical protein
MKIDCLYELFVNNLGCTYLKAEKYDNYFQLQSWTKPLRPFQLILQSYWTLTKQTLSPPPPPQFNVVNNAETTFGYIPWYKLNIELGERGFKKGNMIQHGVYHKNTWIFYRRKIDSTSYVQHCRSWTTQIIALSHASNGGA